jgi:hypothetical protein
LLLGWIFAEVARNNPSDGELRNLAPLNALANDCFAVFDPLEDLSFADHRDVVVGPKVAPDNGQVGDQSVIAEFYANAAAISAPTECDSIYGLAKNYALQVRPRGRPALVLGKPALLAQDVRQLQLARLWLPGKLRLLYSQLWQESQRES